MKNVSLIKFEKSDAKFVQENFLTYFKNFTTKNVENKIEKWRAGLGFCIVYDGQKVGLISLGEKQDRSLNFGIMILPDFRKKGIATAAFDLAKSIAKSKGYLTITSSCAKENLASENLHKKLGFDLEKEEKSPNGTDMLRWKMKI